MSVNPIAASAAPGAASNSPSTAQSTSTGLQPQQITMSDFMTLLSAQLQGQDPTNPVDPTTFVTQLAQFTELDQVTQIESLLQNYFSSTTPGATPSTGSAAPTATNPSAGSGSPQPAPAAS